VENFKADAECQQLLSDEQAKRGYENTTKLSDVNVDDYLALVYVGGHGPCFDLPEDATNIKLAEEFWRQGKIVSAVCHGPAAIGMSLVFRRTARICFVFDGLCSECQRRQRTADRRRKTRDLVQQFRRRTSEIDRRRSVSCRNTSDRIGGQIREKCSSMGRSCDRRWTTFVLVLLQFAGSVGMICRSSYSRRQSRVGARLRPGHSRRHSEQVNVTRRTNASTINSNRLLAVLSFVCRRTE
jgi:hypothetical protein